MCSAANLALKGFVSLAFDPVGQGEREQTYDPQLKAPAAGWSVNEHVHAGAQSQPGRRGRDALLHLGRETIDRLPGQPARRGSAHRRGRLLGRRRADDVHRRPGFTAQSGYPCLLSEFVPADVHRGE